MNWVIRVRFQALWSGNIYAEDAPWWLLLEVQRHMIRTDRIWE